MIPRTTLDQMAREFSLASLLRRWTSAPPAHKEQIEDAIRSHCGAWLAAHGYGQGEGGREAEAQEAIDALIDRLHVSVRTIAISDDEA